MHAMQSYLNSFSCFVENNSKTTARVVAVCEICMSTAAINDLVSSWLLLYVLTKTMHKTHEMINQTQKDDSSCFDDVMQLQALPDIAHSELYAVALDVKKTANSTEYVRIHPVRSHSVSVVTRRRSWLHEIEACRRQRPRGRV